jgi:hypothetical protein
VARAFTCAANPRLQGSPRQKAHFRNGAGLCQGFRASQKSRRRSHSSPSLRHKFKSLLFLFHCNRTSGLRDIPYPGFVLPSVVSLIAATLCLVQIWSWVPIFPAYSAFADNLRAFGISRNLVPARDLDVPVMRRSSTLRSELSLKLPAHAVAPEFCV